MGGKPKQVLKYNLKTKSVRDRKFQPRNIIIIKHFQPRVIYDSAHFNAQNLPEINANVDNNEDINDSKFKTASFKTSPNVKRNLSQNVIDNKLQNNVVHKLRSLLTHTFISKSFVENKVCTPTSLTLKSKSFEDKMYKQSHRLREPQISLPHTSKVKPPESRTDCSNSKLNTDIATPCKTTGTLSTPCKKSDTASTPHKTSDTVAYMSSSESAKFVTKKSDPCISKSYRKKAEQRRSKFTSSSESERNSDYITCLKSEIVLHPALTITSSSDTIDRELIRTRQERINSLRNEINELMCLNGKKRKRFLDLKSEIEEFRKTAGSAYLQNIEDDIEENVCGFNVQLLSTTESEPKVVAPDVIKNVLKECTKYKDENISTNYSMTIPSIGESTKGVQCQQPENEELQEINGSCSTPSINSMSNDTISQKIEKANVLIKRVKQTLDEIKSKKKSKGNQTPCSCSRKQNIKKQEPHERDKPDVTLSCSKENGSQSETDDKENLPWSTESEEEQHIDDNVATFEPKQTGLPVYMPQENFALDLPRPKTRRSAGNEDESIIDVTEKFRTKPNCDPYCVDMTEYDALQTKLNTIIERSETDSTTSDISKKNISKADAKHCECNTDVIETKSQSIDTRDLISQTLQSTQTESNEIFKVAVTQTEKMKLEDKGCQINNKFCNLKAELTNSLSILPQENDTTSQLSAVVLPPVIIPDSLQVQNIFTYTLNSETEIISYRKGSGNIGFFIAEHCDPDDISNKSESSAVIEIQEIVQTTPRSIEVHQTSTKLDLRTPLKKLEIEERPLIKEKYRHTADGKRKQSTVGKTMILKSFQLYDNPNFHDPGKLNVVSLEVLTNCMDENIYKNFINPEGLTKSTDSRTRKADGTISRENTAELPIKITDSTYLSVQSTSSNDLSSASLIGLYAIQAVQCNLDEEENEQETAIKNENRMPHSGRIPAIERPKHVDIEPDLSDYEKISFSISYSTDETNSPASSINLIDQDGIHYSVKDKNEKNISNLGHSTFKDLKEKIEKEHPIESKKADLWREDSTCEVNSATIPDFITGLTSHERTDLEKILPVIRKHTSAIFVPKDISASSVDVKRKSQVKTEKGKKDDLAEKNQEKRIVMNVQGDYLDVDPFRTKELACINPLELGENGRYKDEENLFCENCYPKYEDILHKKQTFQYTPYFTIKSSSNHVNVSFSPSDIRPTVVNSEKSSSDGEIQCCCSTSNAELHYCQDCANKLSLVHKDNISRAIRKKKDIF